MRNTVPSLVRALLALAALGITGCHGPAPAPPVGPVTPVPVAPTKPTEQAPANQARSKTPVKDSLEKLLADDASGEGIFPKGTHLNHVTVKESVATVDFSSEFAALANSGETVESQVQKSLRSTLARFPSIRKMRVTVEGKPFDSQATDWNTPFPVRDSGEVGEQSANSGEAPRP